MMEEWIKNNVIEWKRAKLNLVNTKAINEIHYTVMHNLYILKP